MRYWWVNQNKTYTQESEGGYLWSPKTKNNGSRNHFYDTMTEVSKGDVIFSFSGTYIKAIAVADGLHRSMGKPNEFGASGATWQQADGWYLPATYTPLINPIRPQDHMSRLQPVLPDKYSPIQVSGRGNQGVYLAAVPAPMAEVLIELLNGQVEAAINEVAHIKFDDGAIRYLVEDNLLTTTVRSQLIQARIGQGLFRSRVAEMEKKCRVTGLDNQNFLIASHIKPWSKSDNQERLDGHNGLLLAPHIDRLFDKGYITFANDGSLIMSSKIPANVIDAWGLTKAIPPYPLSQKARLYMQYHRSHIFLR